LFSLASVAFNIAHAPDRPVAQLVFAMAPVALVLTTHLLMQQASWWHQRPATAGQEADMVVPMAGAAGQQPDPEATVRRIYEQHQAAGTRLSGAALARRAGISERHGRRLLAEFRAQEVDRRNGDSPPSPSRTHKPHMQP
jgi:hypothetical protein